MPPLDKELQQALGARISYYRDLGVFDFYRREPAPGAAPAASPDQIAVRSEIEMSHALPAERTLLPIQEDTESIEEEDISARKALPVAPAVGALIAPAERAAALQVIREDIGECTRCALSAHRNKIVFGDGDANARLLFVGEGPGADEDAQGLPFVGRAGQLLNNMIQAMGLKRSQVYIANIVKCRPPQNRVPEAEEAQTCSQFLFRQIDVIRPEVVVALGATAAAWLLGGRSALAGLRGRVHFVRGAKLIVTYHPAYLLRDPRQKKEAWKDLQIAMAELGLQPPKRSDAQPVD
jgi:uracil-DNA glycosylase family 4